MGRTVPVSATKADTQLITGALWNAGPKATGDFLLAPPLFRGTQTANQTISSATWTALNFDFTYGDSDLGHSNSVNNSRYTAQVPGWYWCEGYLATTGGSQCRFGVSIAKNGSIVIGSVQTAIKTNDLQSISGGAAVNMAVGDYVQVLGYQNSGAGVATDDGTDLCPSFNVFWIHS